MGILGVGLEVTGGWGLKRAIVTSCHCFSLGLLGYSDWIESWDPRAIIWLLGASGRISHSGVPGLWVLKLHLLTLHLLWLHCQAPVLALPQQGLA